MSSKNSKLLVSSIKKRQTYIKEVTAETAVSALQNLDDMGHSCFDMIVVELTEYDNYNGVRLKVLAWENDDTRERYDV